MSTAAAAPVQKGHPPGLYMLFFAELWERFCYYGMRALLVVYVAQLFMVRQKEASLVYGGYTALAYALTIFGGYVADRVLGFRRSILLGGALIAIGEFFLTVWDQQMFLVGLSLMVAGNGLFKPNISSLVGKLYPAGDPRRDAGFTIFYMGINVGALIAPLLCAAVSNWLPIQVPLDQLAPGTKIEPEWAAAGVATLPDYRWGFGLAGAGMLLGLIVFQLGQGRLGDKGLPPPGRTGVMPVVWVTAGCLAAVPVIYFLLSRQAVAGYILLTLAAGMVGFILLTSIRHARAGDRPVSQRLLALIVLLLANTVFWSCFEQAGNSLNFFARDYVHMPRIDLGFTEFPFLFEWFQSVNSTFILLLGPVFAWLWIRLGSSPANPSIPTKFGLALVQVGLGFGVVVLFMQATGLQGKVPFLSLVLLYLLHTTGELCISPVGLSMITKLAPANMTGLIMGAWFLSISCALFLAGQFSAGIDEEKAEEVVGGVPMVNYAEQYTFLFWYALVAGVVLLVLSKALNRLMHGIK